MEHLYFGPRARQRAYRRARLKRVALYSWVVTVALAAFGFTIPGPGVALDVLLSSGGQDTMVRAASVGVETTETARSTLRFRREVFDRRPTPKPSPSATTTEAPTEAAPAGYSGSIVEIIHAAAAEFGVSGDWMVAIAQCESGLDPNAYNAAGYHGLFQYDQTTWSGYGYGSIYDPVAQARTTAELLAAGQSSRWPNCS
jgi:soluble lytic murein transglycosylase-like protein